MAEGLDLDSSDFESCNSTFGDSDSTIDEASKELNLPEEIDQGKKSYINQIPPSRFQNGATEEKAKRKRARIYRRKKNRSQAQSTTNVQSQIPVKESSGSECMENKCGNQGHQQMLDPKRFIVSGLKSTTEHGALFRYLTSVTGGDLKELKLLNDGRAVAEVENDILGFRKLKSKIRNRMLKGMRLKVERFRICDSILVSGLPPVISRDIMMLYFNNDEQSGGSGVSGVTFCKDTCTAIVTFRNPKVIANLVKRDHSIETQKVTVEEYFPQIDGENINALTGAISLQNNDDKDEVVEESTAQKPVKPVKQLCIYAEIDDDVMQFIMVNEVHCQKLKGELNVLNAEIEWSSGSNRVTISKKLDSSYVKKWVNRCKTVLKDFLDRFDKFAFNLQESVGNAVSVALPRLAEISPEKALWKQDEEKQELVLVCLKEERDSVLHSAKEVVEMTTKEIRKTYMKETIKDVPHERLLFLKQIGFAEKMEEENLELEVTCTLDMEKREVCFVGPQKQFHQAKTWYRKTMTNINEKILHLPKVISCTDPAKNYFNERLANEDISAILIPETGNTMKIIAGTSQDCERAIKCISNSFRKAEVPFPPGHGFMFETEKWKEITENIKSHQLIHLSINHLTDLVVLQGVTGMVEKSVKEVKEYVESQRIQERMKEVSLGMARFLKENLPREISDIEARLKDDQVAIITETIPYSFILFRGTESGLDECEKSIDELCKVIITRIKKLFAPGLKPLFFSEAGQRNLKVIEIGQSVTIETTTRKSTNRVKETSQLEVEPMRKELKKEKERKLSLVEGRRNDVEFDSKTVESTYELCNFTTQEGLRVSWKYGNIAEETADILVNSAQSYLNYPTACGEALNKVGGPSFVRECCGQGYIKEGDVVRTRSGNLSCNHVLHAVCCSWDNYQGKAEKLLRHLVRKILCQRLRCGSVASVAMPAIGTGKHMFPEEVVFRVIREEVQFFSTCKSFFPLKEIRIILQKQAYSRTPRPLIPPPSSPAYRTAPHQYLWPVRIFLLEGDITQHPADAIINALPQNMHLLSGGGVCRSILRTGGQSIQMQLDTIGKGAPGSVVRTSAGSISNAEMILHFVLASTDAVNLGRAISVCLNQAKSLSLSSVSIPAIGTGPFGVAARTSAEIIVNAVKNFSSHEYYPLDVNMVVFQKSMIQEFETVLKDAAAGYKVPAANPVVLRGSSTQARAGGSSRSVNPKIGCFKPLNTGEPKDAVKLEVFALRKTAIEKSLCEIDKFVDQNIKRSEIEHEKVFDVFVEHWPEVEKLAHDHDVKITCQTPSVASIHGTVSSVSDCKDELQRLINAHIDEERKAIQLRYISRSVQWYSLQEGQAVEYNKELNGQIEMAFVEGKDVLHFTKKSEQYEVDLLLRTEKKLRNGQVSRIERKCLRESDMSLPWYWDPQPQGQVVHLVQLSKLSLEYEKISSHFVLKGGSSRQIVKIERIQNPCLYKAYLVKKQSMNGEDMEMQLFHGTSATNTPLINANNFNRSFAGTNGVAYGKGVYFARDSSYSLKYSQLHGHSFNCQMYVARVLVGRYAKGVEGIKTPPSRNDPANPGVLYDSVVDNIYNPSIFVIFVDNQCYPEYLITFS